MKAQQWGRLIVVGSVNERRPHPDMCVYAATLSASTPPPCQHNHFRLKITITAQISTNSRQNRNLPKGPSPFILLGRRSEQDCGTQKNDYGNKPRPPRSHSLEAP